MGIGRLMELANAGSEDLGGRVRALVAELRHADWPEPDDLARSFPKAMVDGPRVTIALDPDHDVALLVNYAARCVVVEAACRRPGALRKPARRTS